MTMVFFKILIDFLPEKWVPRIKQEFQEFLCHISSFYINSINFFNDGNSEAFFDTYFVTDIHSRLFKMYVYVQNSTQVLKNVKKEKFPTKKCHIKGILCCTYTGVSNYKYLHKNITLWKIFDRDSFIVLNLLVNYCKIEILLWIWSIL